MPDITPKPLRSKANAVINLMGAICGVYTLIMIKVFVKEEDKNSYLKLFLSVSAIMVLAVLILVITIRERKLAAMVAAEDKEPEPAAVNPETDKTKKEFMGMPADVRKSFFFILASIFLWFFAYNAVTSAYSRYVEVVWKLAPGGFANSLLVATIAAIFSYIPIGNIACRIGRKKTIIIGILMMTASYLCGALFVHYSAWVNVIFAFTGIGWAAINVNSYPMVVEMCKGSDVGKYTGIYYMFSMSSQIVTPIVSGALLQYVSYRTLFPYAVVFSLASLCTMLFVKHGDSKPIRKKQAIENFDTED
jgi:MFS family permease